MCFLPFAFCLLPFTFYSFTVMRMLFVLVSLTLLFTQQRGYSPVQDGDAHGDPPYLLEDGWEPLLNGRD